MTTPAPQSPDTPEPQMDAMWGAMAAGTDGLSPEKGTLFRDGNYAMFVHWGLYSHLGGKWQGKTYYGIGEWIMNARMAGIPVDEYRAIADDFNPVQYSAQEVAELARDAGMRYIVITSKHHDGFALFHSKADPFNIVDATPFGRDILRELADACHNVGIGLGFYYSQFQDWTAPGGGRGPEVDNDGRPATFEDYFRRKCLPQVEEITSNYGPLEVVWFDTPGSIEKQYVEELVAVVQRNQPNALINSRIGHSLGDYSSQGDMEVPKKNISGLWEAVDTTNDSWSYAWYDENWKSPAQILERVIATVARGGTYMLNIGPMGDGRLPGRAARALRCAGEWIRRYPQVIYEADPSPWQHALPWGDVTMRENTLHLCISDWPEDGRLWLPGLQTAIVNADLLGGPVPTRVEVTALGRWTSLELPPVAPDTPISVVSLELAAPPRVDSTHGVDPALTTTIPAIFAQVTDADQGLKRWMEKFGEWKSVTHVSQWGPEGTATWDVDVLHAGHYQVELTHAGDDRLEWAVGTDEDVCIRNQQNASHIYTKWPIGWLEFRTSGPHTITVRLLDGDRRAASLQAIHLTPIEL